MSDAVTIQGSGTDDAADAIESLLGAEVEAQEDAGEAPAIEEAEPEEEVQADAGEEAEDEAPAEEVEEEPLDLQSFDELVEALETDNEFLGNLKAKVKVQGEEFEVTFDELRAGYQKGSDYAKNVEQLKAERAQFEQMQAERMQMFEQDHATNAMFVQGIENQITQAMDSEEMAQLRQTNVQEWTARRLDFQDRLQQVQQLKQEAAARYQQAQMMWAQDQQAQLAAVLEKEGELLNAAIPDWSNSTKQTINTYLTDTYGYSPQDLQGISDHRLVVLANKARMWDEQQASAEVTKKKVKAAPKLIKPTAKVSNKPKTNKVATLKKQLQKSGHINDAASLIENLL